MSDQKVDFNLKVISPNIGANSTTRNGGITTSTDLVEINLFLFVKIVRATNLFGHYGYNNCDPYVEIIAGSFQGKTLCFRGTSDPEWNQVFALEKGLIQTEEITTVEILVKDNFLRYDQYIGKISLNISDISTRFPTDSALAPQWCQLEDPNGRKCRAGLMVSCWIGTQADESFHEAWHLQLGDVTTGVQNTLNTCSRIYLMPRVWCLRVTLIQIEELIFDVEGPSQIFIRATLGNWNFTSKLANIDNGNTMWNEEVILFAVSEPFDQILSLSVEQGTLRRHKSLGTCVFPVKNSDMMSPPSTKTVAVMKNEGFVVGKLSMTLYLDGRYHMFDEDPRYSSDVNPTSNMLWRQSIGVFEMGILNATGLPAMKSPGRTDAYCVAKYGSKWIRSRTVVNSLSPKWNEQYSWDVYDPCTFITICVFDNNHLEEGNIAAGAMDTRIGKVRIRLSEMGINRIYIYSYPLVELQPSGLKRMGEIQLAFKFTCPDMFNMCMMYTLPMLPGQHFSDPLSPTQVFGLRRQTIMLVLSKMSKAEPPLRREVIDYMLDSREIVWSMRRCRADFERINVFVSWLVGICNQFNEICKWTNPISTIIIWLVFLIVIIYPQNLMPAMFSCLILHVLQQLERKPKTLSHVDLHLSHVHTASIDELEEEFDPMPSKFGDVIMRNRYDRLRVAAGKYVTLMGEFATRMERLQSLLSWHDSIATMLAMILCLIIGIVTLIVPFQGLVFVWLLYLLRHPIFRSPFPPFYENWLRRMPSKLDSMI